MLFLPCVEFIDKPTSTQYTDCYTRRRQVEAEYLGSKASGPSFDHYFLPSVEFITLFSAAAS